MKNKAQKPMFPQDIAQAETMEKVTNKLEEIAQNNLPEGMHDQVQNSKTVDNQTLADDFDLTAEQAELIQTTEGIVRELFTIMGGNYDALIAMDGKSPYSRLVDENPLLSNQVKDAKNPVLEAVRLAVGFKPYQEFMDKYGSTPDAIKDAMRKEIEEEFSKESSASEKKKLAEKKLKMPVFSSYGNVSSEHSSGKKNGEFSDVFKR